MVARRTRHKDGCKEKTYDGFKEKKTLGWLQGRRRHEDGCKEKKA
jgi:hypothetical protein